MYLVVKCPMQSQLKAATFPILYFMLIYVILYAMQNTLELSLYFIILISVLQFYGTFDTII